MDIMENAIYVDYNGHVKIDDDIILVAAWNKYIEEGGDNNNKILFNDAEFFEENFKNAYDAACIASLSEAWLWYDRFVFFNGEGFLTSFSHWNDENSPIDIDKIDISILINNLKKRCVNNTPVNNIPRAIHDALKSDNKE